MNQLMDPEKNCILCCHWDRSIETHRGHCMGACCFGPTSCGIKFTTYDYACDDFEPKPVTPCPASDCTKLADIEKRVVLVEATVVVNRTAYDRHVQQHNGETIT